MKNIYFKLINQLNKLHDFFKEKDRLGNQRSGSVVLLTFFSSALMIGFGNEATKTWAVYGWLIIMGLFMLLFSFDVELNRISQKIAREYNTTGELLKSFTHFSYIFGLVFYTTEIFAILGLIIISISILISGKLIYGELISWWLPKLLLSLLFVFTFLYFLYHIYFRLSDREIEEVQQRIQLYTAIGTTVSFLMMVFGENQIFKIFLVGTLLEFTWLQYIITKEKNNFCEKSE